ncbi:carbon-nitrogen hydrolase family protein [Paenarthrobacter sp. NPDC091669]|uniref:carbon-nitrogen hydrolase family protein n=1 Tax=Paenarthrobacter sp. NPDC091669 TaxID=3364384 RepID=UPI0037FF3681
MTPTPPQVPTQRPAQPLDAMSQVSPSVESRLADTASAGPACVVAGPRPGEEPDGPAMLRAAVVQYEALLPGAGGVAVEANVAAHVELVELAHSRGARLVLFPELSLTGYELTAFEVPGGARWLSQAIQPSPGSQPSPWLTAGDPRLQPLQDVCARTGTVAVVGAGWREADQTPRLASLVVGPDGSVKPVFKTHLHGPERELFVSGSGPVVVDVDGWRVAFAVCADAAHPAHAGAAAEAGADVYAVSALYTRGEELRLGLHLGARSMDHRMFGLLANLGGETPLGPSCGLSGGWGPDGTALVRVAGTGTEVAMVSLDRSRLAAYRSTAGA